MKKLLQNNLILQQSKNSTLNPNITVFTEPSLFGKAALLHAHKLAQIFDADINEISLHKKLDLNSVFMTAEEGNTLCFVMAISQAKEMTFFNAKKARKWIVKSRVPVLAVGNIEIKENDYQHVVFPLDTRCHEKELALWASYFPTYWQKNCAHLFKEKAMIHIIFNEYQNKLLRKKVQNNIDFVSKMFDNLNVSYSLHPFAMINNIHTFGLSFATKTNNSFMLFLMTEHLSLIDLLFGPLEKRILGNKENIPVLCLNAREDIFVLCQ